MAKSNQQIGEVPVLRTTEVQTIANELLESAKLAVTRAIKQMETPERESFPSRGNSLEEIILKRLKTRKPEAQKRALSNYSKLLGATNSRRLEGVRTDIAEPVLQQLRQLSSNVTLSLDTMAKEGFGEPDVEERSERVISRSPISRIQKKEVGAGAQVMAKSLGGFSQMLYRELELRVHKLECVMTTSGSGDDEISLDGLAITANGTIKNLSTIINDKRFNYDEGDALKYEVFNPPKVFARFKFDDDNMLSLDGNTYEVGWPRNYGVTFLMAEIDNGGFPGFVKDIAEKLKSAAIAEVKSAVAGAIGSAVGTPIIGALASALAYVAGKITDWLITNFTNLIIELYEDNAFTPLTAQLKISGPAPDSMNQTSNVKVLWWKQHGGHYKLYFDWNFNKEYLVTPMEADILSPGAISWFSTSNTRKSRYEVFMRGLDRRIYRSFWHDNAWSNWGTFPNAGATFKSAPAVTSWKHGRLELFALGEDNKIYQNSLDNMNWSGWGNTYWKDFLFQFGLAAVSRKPNYVDLFAIGMDRRIYNFFWNGQSWSGLRTDLPMGIFKSAPAVTSRSPDSLDVVAMGDDRRIYISSWKDSWEKWSSWSPIGNGTFTSAPAICSWDENRLHVFARGDDRRIYHAFYSSASGWSNWGDEISKSGTFLSGPAAVSEISGLIDLYAIGDDQSMWRNVFDGTKWLGWFNDFKPGTFK